MKVRKGDTVQIMVGKDANKRGKVLSVDYKNSRVLIEGLNLYKKHKKPKKQGEKGEIINIVRPINIANVSLFCSKCNKPVRVGYKIEGEKKLRICKKCKNNL